MDVLRKPGLGMLLLLASILFIVGRTEAASEGTRFAEIRAEYEKFRNALLDDKKWKDFSDEELLKGFILLWSVGVDWTVAYLEETPNVTADARPSFFRGYS